MKNAAGVTGFAELRALEKAGVEHKVPITQWNCDEEQYSTATNNNKLPSTIEACRTSLSSENLAAISELVPTAKSSANSDVDGILKDLARTDLTPDIVPLLAAKAAKKREIKKQRSGLNENASTFSTVSGEISSSETNSSVNVERCRANNTSTDSLLSGSSKGSSDGKKLENNFPNITPKTNIDYTVNPVVATWLREQVAYTADYSTESGFWWMISGGLNMQVIHHVMPGVSHSHYTELYPKFVEVLQKHGIEVQYKSTMWDNCVEFVRWIQLCSVPEPFSMAVSNGDGKEKKE